MEENMGMSENKNNYERLLFVLEVLKWYFIAEAKNDNHQVIGCYLDAKEILRKGIFKEWGVCRDLSESRISF